MPELPWEKWYPTNWASEPGLRQCDAATRGIWFEAINTMMLHQTDSVSGTIEELASLCFCRVSQMELAIEQIRKFNVGIVGTKGEQNANIILTCRKRTRDCHIKEIRRFAGVQSGNKRRTNTSDDVGTKREQPSASASVYASTSASSPKEGSVRETKRPTIEEVKLVVAKCGLPESDAIWFWNKCEANGWTNGGQKIKSWVHVIAAWKAAGYMPSQKSNKQQQSKQQSGNF